MWNNGKDICPNIQFTLFLERSTEIVLCSALVFPLRSCSMDRTNEVENFIYLYFLYILKSYKIQFCFQKLHECSTPVNFCNF